MSILKRLAAVVAVVAMLTACGAKEMPPQTEEEPAGTTAVTIELSDESIKVDGGEATDNTEAAVYVAKDIIYYEEGKDFTYGEGDEADAHSAEEAAAHTVVHITQPGTYSVSGTLSKGQIAVDLGEDAEKDPNAVVTLVLNGVDLTCTVAPAVMFYNVYECGSTDTETATKDVDTSAAGANVIIADGTANTVTGSHVARIYKPDSVELNEDGTEVLDAKKLHKYDAAFYSRMSMNVNGGAQGSGVLDIVADNEGLDSELHLTINGGDINIVSGNDGINTNEDGVSVTTVNGGNLNILVTGETGEGDGIDSNGWLVINGGTVTAVAYGYSMDSGIDSDMGIHINGGSVMATGNMLDRIEEGGQNYAVFNFAGQQNGEELQLKNLDGEVVLSVGPVVNPYSILIVSSPELVAGDYTLWSGEVQLAGSAGGGMMGGPGMGGMMPQMPDGFDPSQMPEMPGGGGFPDDFDFSQMPGGMPMPEDFDPSQRPGGMAGAEGFDPNRMPEGGRGPGGMGGFPGWGSGEAGEQSEVFSVADGGAMFNKVAPMN